jgi:hypothetical protein
MTKILQPITFLLASNRLKGIPMDEHFPPLIKSDIEPLTSETEERNLIASLLTRSIQDVLYPPTRRDALRWVNSNLKHADDCLTFCYVCEVLDICHLRLRRQIRNLAKWAVVNWDSKITKDTKSCLGVTPFTELGL